MLNDKKKEQHNEQDYAIYAIIQTQKVKIIVKSDLLQ